jgi:hypothetical protein
MTQTPTLRYSEEPDVFVPRILLFGVPQNRRLVIVYFFVLLTSLTPSMHIDLSIALHMS